MTSNKKHKQSKTLALFTYLSYYIFMQCFVIKYVRKIQQKSKERGKSMLQLERQQKILDYLKENRKATTNELSELLGVSTTTIRTDLNQMDKEKLLTKTHGGAIYKDKTHDMTDLTSRAYLFHDRALENKEAKEEIANEAIKLVSDHMCIFLDASSTAYTLGMKLSGFTELTVITNGINLALELKDIPGVTVILTGGIVTSASASIEGLLGADLLKRYTQISRSCQQEASL